MDSAQTQMNEMDAATWHVLRRKKRRRTIVKGIGLLALVPMVALVWVGVLYVRVSVLKPKVTRDYVAELNAEVAGVPESERAWPTLREAHLAKLRIVKSRDWSQGFPVYWDAPEYAAVAARMEEIEDELAKVREASRRPKMGKMFAVTADEEYERQLAEATGEVYEVMETAEASGFLLDVRFDELSVMRDFARDMAMSMVVSAGEGDGRGTADDFVTMLHLARLGGQNASLIGQLIQIAIEELGFKTLREVLMRNRGLFDAADLAMLDEALRTVGRSAVWADNGMPMMVMDTALEEMWFEDIVQRVFTDDGQGNGKMTVEGAKLFMEHVMGEAPSAASRWGATMMAMTSASRAELTAQHRTFFESFEKATMQRPWERDAALLAMPPRMGQGGVLNPQLMLDMLLPAISRAAERADGVNASREEALTVVALERYRREHGVYPAALEALVPGLLPGLPRNVSDGEVVEYRQVGDGYSLGGVEYFVK